MKKLLFSLLCFFILAFISSLSANTIFVQTPAGGVACTAMYEAGAHVAGVQFTTMEYFCGSFDGNGSAVTKAYVYVCDAGELSGTYQLKMYSDDTGNNKPLAAGLLGTSTATRNMEGSGCYSQHDFLFDPGVATSNGTIYWICVEVSENQSAFYASRATEVGQYTAVSEDGGTSFATSAADTTYRMSVYYGECSLD